MYNLEKDLIDAIESTPDTLRGLLEGIGQEKALSAKGGDENWSIVEVVCHLRDAEEISLQRLQAMRDQENPSITGYDQAALAIERNYQQTPLKAALDRFSDFRKQYAAVLANLKPEDWQRTGSHNEFGQITILAHTIHHVTHDFIHCAQIARQLGLES